MAVRKVEVTLPEELYAMVERAREVEHRTRSEVVQEALRSHFGADQYLPTVEERQSLNAALTDLDQHPKASRSWEDVRRELWPTM